MKKTVLITGSSQGIGAKCAKKFAANGYVVAINYFKSKQQALILQQTIQKRGGVAKIFYGNVAKQTDVENLFKKISNWSGFPGILINNAGVNLQKLFCKTSLNEWNNVFDVNLKSMFFCCKKALPHMIKNKWGRIVNISSIWGVVGGSCEVAYSAAKAGVVGFSKALALEMAPSQITVNCVAPGVVDTKMTTQLTCETINLLKNNIPVGRLATPSDVANAVFFLASEQASYITGQVLNVNGGFTG